jgi:hypothetical protein
LDWNPPGTRMRGRPKKNLEKNNRKGTAEAGKRQKD